MNWGLAFAVGGSIGFWLLVFAVALSFTGIGGS